MWKYDFKQKDVKYVKSLYIFKLVLMNITFYHLNLMKCNFKDDGSILFTNGNFHTILSSFATVQTYSENF